MTVRWMTAFIDRPTEGYDAAERFWLWVTGTSLSARRGSTGEFATFVPGAGDAYLRVQRVDDGPGGSHLDLHVDDVAATAARAASLGAEEVDRSEGLAVMRSPSGLPWCVVRHHGEAVAPAPVVLDDGTVVRLDQLCLDVPHDRFDGEVDFWTALTGWEPRPVHPTFTFLFGPRHHALHLLLQRREDGEGPARAHLDLAADDRPAAVRAHVARGARVVAVHPQWTVLLDPSGAEYCVTDRPVGVVRPGSGAAPLT